MESNRRGNDPGRWRQWTGRGLSGLAVLFLLFDGTGKLFQVQPVVEGTLQLGYPRDAVFTLGVILVACVLVYVIPRTSVLGALLLSAVQGSLNRRTFIDSLMGATRLFCMIALILSGGNITPEQLKQVLN